MITSTTCYCEYIGHTTIFDHKNLKREITRNQKYSDTHNKTIKGEPNLMIKETYKPMNLNLILRFYLVVS